MVVCMVQVLDFCGLFFLFVAACHTYKDYIRAHLLGLHTTQTMLRLTNGLSVGRTKLKSAGVKLSKLSCSYDARQDTCVHAFASHIWQMAREGCDAAASSS